MRSLVFLVVATAFAAVLLAQNVPPPWPQIPLNSCPALAQPRDLSQWVWKHGQPERDGFATSLQMYQAKNYRAAADGFGKFADKFPDSDYRDSALISEMEALFYLKDESGLLRVAEQIVRLPLAEPLTREIAFAELSGTLSPYVRPDDPEKERKLGDLEKWTRCGEEAHSVPQSVPENLRRPSENVLDRTAGFVAYMRQDYVLANAKLEAASKLNSQDALTYLWLASTKFFLPVPDSNSGIFYLV